MRPDRKKCLATCSMEPETPVTRKKTPIPFPIGSPEHHEERKRRMRENWKLNEERYRPPTPAASKGEAPPTPPRQYQWTIPADLHEALGEKITLPEDWSAWPMFHIRRQSELSKTTLQQYKSYYYKLPQREIYDVIRVILTYPLAQQNQYAKAGLSYSCQHLYDSIYERRRKNLPGSAFYKSELQRMMVFGELCKRTKRATYEKHSSQETSEERMEAIVEWRDWEELARRFVRALTTKKDATDRDKQEAMIAAVYSMIPPVRLDWNDIEVRRTKGGATLAARKGEVGKNILYMAPMEAVVFWGEFKNSASFGDQMPLKQVLPRTLVNVFKKVLPEGDSTPLKIKDFSSVVTNLAEQITGKRFSNQLMRSSYIKHWHEQNTKGSVNVEATKEVMRLMHQSNMQVHLAYVKLHLPEVTIPEISQTEE